MDKTTGGCLCGKVRFEAAGEPLRVGICHCLDCRKHHGAVFYAAAIFDEQAVTVEGEPHAYQGRHFCPECGSSLFAVTGTETELHLGALDEPNRFWPDYEVWTERREHWLPAVEGCKQHQRDKDEA